MPNNTDLIEWERVYSNFGDNMFRAKVFGGWLVRYDSSITFVPDINYAWQLRNFDLNFDLNFD